MSEPAERELAVFSAARQLPAGERAAYLNEACGHDAALRERIEELLRASEEAGAFLHQPAVGAQRPLDVSSCRECRAALPFNAPHGLCPSCLLRMGLGQAATRLLEIQPGQRIGRYKLLEQIGEGGCGVVYMAEQEQPVRRRVALKVIKLGMDTKQVVARFEAERQALALMDHPNIAKVFEAGATETGRPYFVMELVHGIKITQYCDENNLATEERLGLFIQVAQAVQHAHQKGIIHRDIKPSNILVSDYDGVAVPKVIDFGIAKATTDQRLTDKTLFTAFEQFLGTPAYMSPEQARMSGLDIDTRTDIYSLGVLLYELLTGKTPFDAQELLAAGLDEMRRTISEKEPARPSTRLSTMLEGELTTTARHRRTDAPKLVHLVRGDLDWIVMKALEKDRARRYETANGLATDIQRHLKNEPVAARPPSNLYRFRKLVRRNKLAFAAAGAISTLLVLGVMVSTLEAIRATRAQREQTRLRQVAETKEKKSEQVAQLLTDMLRGVGPSVALGRDATMLREILDKTAQRIGKELTNQPEVELELSATLADTYHDLGLYKEMEKMSRQGLQLARSQRGEEDEDVAILLTSLGDALMHLGNLDESEKLSREALALQRKLLGNERLDKEQRASAARSLHILAHILGTRGRLAEAESLEREALALTKKLLGNGHPDVATPLGNLGSALLQEGKLSEAEILLREALAIERKEFGDEHPAIASTLDNLAQVFRKQGKLAEAETMFREGLLMRRKLLGNEHAAVAISLNNLATVLSEQRNLPEAETIYCEALALRRKLFGNEHPDVASVLRNLGGVLRDQGKLPEAEIMYREALPVQRKQLGDAHPELVASLDNLAVVLSDQGKLAEAEAMYREELTMRRKLFGNEDPDVADCLNTLAHVLSAEDKLAEAENTLRDALAVLRKTSTSDPSREVSLLGVVLPHLAELLQQHKGLAEARPLAEEATSLYQRHPDWPPDERRHAFEVLAEVLTDLGDFPGVEALYRGELAHLGKASANGATHELPEVGVILHHLAEALRKQKAFSEARSLAEEAAAMYRRHPDWPYDEREHAFAVLGDVLTDLGDFAGLEPLLREQLRISRLRLASDDPELAAVIAQLISALLEEKKFAEAEPLACECLTIREKKLPDDWRNFNARSMLGGALLGQKNYAEAESLLLSGYQGMKQREAKIPLNGKPCLKETLQRLVQLYEATGSTGQAAAWKQQLTDFQ